MAEPVERIADWTDDREVLLIELTDEWLWSSDAGIDWFTAFIAADARRASDETIRSLAAAMVAHRCAYVSAWGADCERVHHLFDEAYLDAAPHRIGRWRTRWSPEIPFLMTTSHADERLASALWFAVYHAWPSADGYFEERRPMFVALAEPQFRAEVRDLLLDPERLTREADVDEE